MYITITAQKTKGNYSQSVADFVSYLEKENEGKSINEIEYFFNQQGDKISSLEVILEIDKNTSKLKKVEPKYYSITINPSSSELKRLQNSSEDLKRYTREVMKDYARAFNREINGLPISVADIKYFAKIEHQRTFKGTDRQIIENQPYATKILRLKNEIKEIEKGKVTGNVIKLKASVNHLEKAAPHQQAGKRIVRGMVKEESQSHIHIIVSRKDTSNRFSLSPGSKYKASEVIMNGFKVKRGFDRDGFFSAAEKKFDKLFQYNRNYVESYAARKLFIKSPSKYFASIMGLPTNQRAAAFNLLSKTGVNTALLSIPTNKVQLALKAIKKLQRGIEKSFQSSSIEI